MTETSPTLCWQISSAWTTRILVISIGVWVGSLAAVMLSLHIQQQSKLFLARSDSSWNAFQVSQESNKLQVMISDLIRSPGSVALKPLRTRIDVLISRITLLPGLDGAAFSEEEWANLRPQVATVRGFSDRLVHFADTLKSDADLESRRDELFALNREVQLAAQDLSLAVHLANTTNKAGERVTQQRLFWLIEAAVGGIIASFAGLILLHVKKARRIQDAYLELLDSERRYAHSAEALRAHEQHEERLQRELALMRKVKTLGSAITGSLAQIGDATHSLAATSDDMLQASNSIQRVVQETTSYFAASTQRVHKVHHASRSLVEATRVVSQSVEASRELVEVTARNTGQGHLSVKSLVAAASQIADVAASIKGIADQTNLLALNATIEAARAGEAGRGFAVVAQEVKQLALQTSQATSQITDLIASIQAAGRSSLELFASLESGVTAIVAKNDGVSAAIDEQLEHVNTITGITEIASPASRNAGVTYEALAQTVKHIDAVAGTLAELSTSLDGRVREILTAARDLEAVGLPGGEAETSEVGSARAALRA
jgi:methyl-accepting chemotaxis protein